MLRNRDLEYRRCMRLVTLVIRWKGRIARVIPLYLLGERFALDEKGHSFARLRALASYAVCLDVV